MPSLRVPHSGSSLVAPEPSQRPQGGLRRREALKLLGTGMALAASGCGKPPEQIVPYVEMPKGVVPGIPLQFASTLALSGYGRGVLVVSYEGRPTKIEGNPRHPGSLGSTDVFLEAEIYNLYNPERVQAVLVNKEIRSWEDFFTAWADIAIGHSQDKGAGLRILTGKVTSPTLVRQLKTLQTIYPQMVWHAYETLETQPHASTTAAFGKPLDVLPRIAGADVVLSLDSRFLDAGPQQIPLGREFSDRRRIRRGTTEMLRLYALESIPTLTGANADNVLSITPGDMARVACAIAFALGGAVLNPELTGELSLFADAVIRDLRSHPGRALVLGGPVLTESSLELVHWINARLNAPINYIDPVAGSAQQPGLPELTEDLRQGRVQSLFVLDCNPVYDAPADLDFATALIKAKHSFYFGQTIDETANLSEWVLPASHSLESWSDLRALDGTASIVQPLILPMYDTRTAHDVLAMLGGTISPSSYAIVRETWRDHWEGGAFEEHWRRSLEEGVIEGTAAKPVETGSPKLPEVKLEPPAKGTVLILTADPTIWDGTYAENPWLQECPKPLTKQVWGNALRMNAAYAAKLGLAAGDNVRINHGSRHTDIVLQVQEGHADGVASLTLGYGRWIAGAIGTGLGGNGYALRDTSAPWVVEGITIDRLPSKSQAVFATAITKLDSSTDDLYPIFKLADFEQANLKKEQVSQPSLLPKWPFIEPAWGMVIDNSVCIGCNACVIACQAENNVPVVGPEEIANGRIMHWLRIDDYQGTKPPSGQPRIAGFEPVPCMHCEHAPCEPVCPVEASVHDSQGLNLQVYNRCIGTRFCEANCPYKVRRFNFFAYAMGQEYKDLGAEVLRAQKNPEVTIRSRGVMEKCTYCIQRIARAQHSAAVENREIREGEVVTACQAACPTRAIHFGDLKKSGSVVAQLQTEPQHFALLGHLGTRPRTTYLARVNNPNPALERTEG